MHCRRSALVHIVTYLSFCLAPPGLAVSRPLSPVETPPPATQVTVDQALKLAFHNRPEIKAFYTDLMSAEVRRRQAILPPNPELGLEWDNLGGSLPGDEVQETTLSLSQTIELAGKSTARTTQVSAEIARLALERKTAWLDLAAEVREAYLAVQSAHERLTLEQEAEAIAADLADITHERVAAGELAATEETRALARRGESLSEIMKAKRIVIAAELDLTALLSAASHPLVTATTGLAPEVDIPELAVLLAEIEDSPHLALKRQESELAASGVVLEQANRWPDPTLSLSVREIPDLDGRAVAIGVAIPLPLFHRNQSALAEALASERKAEAAERAAGLELRTKVMQAHANLTAADQEARTLRQQVLSRATEAAEAVREGYRAGKFRYNDVLESSQTQVAVKIRHLEAVIDLHRAAIALDRLRGRPGLPEIAHHDSFASNPRSTP